MSYENVAERVLKLGKEQAGDASDLLEVMGSLVYEFILQNDYADQTDIPVGRADDRQIFQLHRLILIVQHFGEAFLERLEREGASQRTQERLAELVGEVREKGDALDAYQDQLLELTRREHALEETCRALEETRSECEAVRARVEEWERWKETGTGEAAARAEELRNEYLTLRRIWNAYREDPFVQQILREQFEDGRRGDGLPAEITSMKELEDRIGKICGEIEKNLRLFETMIVYLNRSLEEVTSDERN
ncbi:MAG: hypothetical protein IJH75_02925 [Mogibacterium sp.]|nr:hypothetical protein [Mogibacterium sp.]